VLCCAAMLSAEAGQVLREGKHEGDPAPPRAAPWRGAQPRALRAPLRGLALPEAVECATASLLAEMRDFRLLSAEEEAEEKAEAGSLLWGPSPLRVPCE